MKRHKQTPLPDYRKASVKIVGEDTPEALERFKSEEKHFKAVMRRTSEHYTLATIYGLLEPPEAIAGRKLSKPEIDAYTLAVNQARGTASDAHQFPRLCSLMAEKHNARFFLLCAAAMEAVKADREAGWNATDGHRMAALQAKLELEANLGRLPTQLEVKRRAFDILMRCKWRQFEVMEPESKRWWKILESVGLRYLKGAVKGKG